MGVPASVSRRLGLLRNVGSDWRDRFEERRSSAPLSSKVRLRVLEGEGCSASGVAPSSRGCSFVGGFSFPLPLRSAFQGEI